MNTQPARLSLLYSDQIYPRELPPSSHLPPKDTSERPGSRIIVKQTLFCLRTLIRDTPPRSLSSDKVRRPHSGLCPSLLLTKLEESNIYPRVFRDPQPVPRVRFCRPYLSIAGRRPAQIGTASGSFSWLYQENAQNLEVRHCFSMPSESCG